jgi:hypothetical protein
MSYTPDIFNRYKEMIDKSGSHLIRSIMHLLKPADGYPAFSNAVIQERHALWQADCRAMDAACAESWHSEMQAPLSMPPEHDEHRPCRMMAAVLIELDVYGEHTARHNLVVAVEAVRANLETCSTHLPWCACRSEGYHANSQWTYENKKLVEDLGRELEIKRRADLSEIASIGGAPAHVAKCACGTCYNERLKNGTQDAYMAELRADIDRVLGKVGSPYTNSFSSVDHASGLLGAAKKADDAIAAARAMPGGSNDDGFLKNLFKTVQGVNYDDKCPHELPFYACMSCSH